MRLATLYLRSRLAGYGAATVLAVALFAWGTSLGVPYPPSGIAQTKQLVVLVLSPLACACVVGAGAHSPFGETERTVAYPLHGIRTVHLVGLISWAGLLLVLGASAHDANSVSWECIRNLAGLSGLALLTARILGGYLSWTVPVFYATAAPFVLRGPDDEKWAWLAWVYRPGSDNLSWIIASSLLAAGLIAWHYPSSSSSLPSDK